MFFKKKKKKTKYFFLMCRKNKKFKHDSSNIKTSKKNKVIKFLYVPACIFCGWGWSATLDNCCAKIFDSSPTEIDMLHDQPVITFQTAHIWSIKDWTFFFNISFNSWVCAGRRLMKFESQEPFYSVTNNLLANYVYLSLTLLPISVTNLIIDYVPRILLQMESQNYFICIDEFTSFSAFILISRNGKLPSIFPQKFGYGCRCDEKKHNSK